MCDLKACGGRRCPSSQPAHRSAYRKAHKASQLGVPIGDSHPPTIITPAPPAWNAASTTATASQLCDLMRPDSAFTFGLEAEASREVLLARTQARGHIAAKYGTVEQAVSAVGRQMADEAERRAGVTATQLAETTSSYKATQQQLAADKTAEAEKLEAAANATPAGQEFQRIEAAYREKFAADPYEARRSDLRKERDDAYRVLCDTDEWRQMIAAKEAAREAQCNAARGWTDETREQMKRLSDAYLEVLAETRPLGGEPTWHPKTQKKAAEAFHEAAQLFPADWVDKHNAGSPVLARISKRRAHYTAGKWVETKKKVRHHRNRILDESDPAPESDEYTTWREGTDEEAARHTMYHGQRLLVGEQWETHSSWRGELGDKPRGTGWQVYTRSNGTQLWRRPLTGMQTVSSEVVPEITTNASPSIVQRGQSHISTFSTSSHELCHRFESMMPEIGRLEHEFLKRRTTDADTGEQDEQIALYGGRRHNGRQELSRPDGFADAYMGKTYGGATYFEVLSTGVEAVFSGEYGGLAGGGRYTADNDMRDFVLGVLATAGRPPSNTTTT